MTLLFLWLRLVLLVVEPDYLPDLEVCFSRAWTPFPNGGCGGISPPQLSPRGSRGGGAGGDDNGSAPEVKYWEKIPCKIL
jgi:hypothetical protein